MNGIAITFVVANAIALMFLPRRLAPLPLLVGTCYMTLGQGFEAGPFSFTVIRMLVAAGFLRVLLRGERLQERINGMDWLMLLWAFWALCSSLFHQDVPAALVNRLGLVYNACGIYFLLRIFCQSLDDVAGLCRVTAILLVPLAVEMVYESLTAHNLFSLLGRVPETPVLREGRVRAQGPFAHSILAGTIGAVCLPFVIALWRTRRKEALAGISACLIMIVTSTSSGPILSAVAAVGALFMWRYRRRMRFVLWMSVIGYLCLDAVMKVPAYFLIARIDLAGGSKGWHRTRLIQSAFEHLSEWWAGGTDYTRHWMPTGVSWSPDHTDITNHYLHMGVIGGLPLMLLFIGLLVKGFASVGRIVRQRNDLEPASLFMIWALGSSLFAHAATFLSVAYFDQSFVFLYLTLAIIGSAWSVTMTARETAATADMHQRRQMESRRVNALTLPARRNAAPSRS